MSAEIVALLVLAGGAVAAVAFTVVVVVTANRSAEEREPGQGSGMEESREDRPGGSGA